MIAQGGLRRKIEKGRVSLLRAGINPLPALRLCTTGKYGRGKKQRKSISA